MRHRTFHLVPPHGDPVHGDLRLPAGADTEAAVVVAHGFKGFKDWGFFPYVCERLAEEGFAAVSFNFSRNGVRPSEPTEFTDLEAFARNTVSRELEDLEWVLKEIREGGLLGKPPRRVGLLGHSRGGGDAVLIARERPEAVTALVTWCAVATLERWPEETRERWRAEGRIHLRNARTGQDMPLDVSLLEDLEANRQRFDLDAAAAAVRAPWLIVHGAEDESVPVVEAERLHRASAGAELLVLEGAGHTFGARHPFAGAPPELEQALRASVDHFRRHLLGS